MAMAATSGSVYITSVEKQGAFLKIWGQIDRQLHSIIEKSLQQMTNQFDQGHFVPTLESIQVGILCCAKYKDGAYYRARITNTTMLQQNVVEVQFVDYGNREILPIINLRTIASFAPGLITIPPQAKDFILANVTHHGVAWDNGTLALINSEVRYVDLQWVIISQIGSHTLIKLYKNGEDLALSLFNRGLILSIASTAQHMILQNTAGGNASPAAYQVTPPPVQQPMVNVVAAQLAPPVAPAVATPPPALLTFKAVSLEPGTECHVYVSYVSDGPCHFSVQLKRLEDNLARLMKELNRMNLQPLEDDPLPGTVCVARCLEDDHICRAVVTSMVDGQYKVFYVDFGNTEVVPIDNLYQIPFKYVIPKVMAMRYALSGLDRSSVTLEMKCVFKEYVSDKLLRMQTLPPPTRSALPLCTLWDDANNVNMLDILQHAALKAYPEPIQLTRGFSQEVRVSYVHSCSHFYVQVKTKEEELRKVMAELQVNCPHSDQLQPAQIKYGQPCCALFDADGQWYRAQILECDGENVKVRYVDYGNEEPVVIGNLKMPRGELLTALRPQALECCLNGYQNMQDDLERDNILEELILEKEFTMKVIEMQGNRALVELNDSSRYNVGSLLLEKLASAHSQVSPLLIQDSHHIEQRKRKSPNAAVGSQSHRLERAQSRDEKAWSPKPASNDKGWSSPKQNTNDKGWNSSKPSNDSGWGNNRQDSFNRQDSYNKQDSFSRQDSWRQAKSPRREDGGDTGDSFDQGRGRSYRKEGGDRGDSFDQGRGRSYRKEGGDRGDSFDQGKGRRDNFSKKEGWGGDEPSWKKNAKSPNQKEGGEKGWSDGSEKNWRRSDTRSDAQNGDRRPRRKLDSGGRSDSWKSSGQDNTWNNDSNVAKVLDPAPSTASFLNPDLTGKSEKVLVSWFHDPGYFFCQLQESEAEFRTLMDDIQNTYCKIKPESVPMGAPAVALFPDDSVRYRVRVLEVQGMQYRVQYVDFGNVSTTDTVWPIENKFMQLPVQAICCGLNALAPPESGWPSQDSFSAYFDKESFTCSFISRANDKYSVDLTCGDQNVSEGLVAAGLATYDGYNVQDNFDPSVLLGQQIRMTLGEVYSLDSFYVQLQNGSYLLCTMHNLQSATETFEDTLKQCAGSIVIMYVDNVFEEKTEITLYDATGTKLKIIEPDEGAYESLELPCPLPVLYATMNGWISFLAPADGEKHRLFIQPSEYADTLAQLLDELFKHYNSSVQETPLQLDVGALCAAHSTDGNWYRAQVTSVEEEAVTVTFLDYGNSESIPSAELRELAQEFLEQHLLALEVLASGVDESFAEEEVTANLWYGENGWEGEILKVVEAAAPQQNELPVTEAPASVVEEKPIEPKEESVIPTTTEPLPVQQADQPAQVGVTVILSHVDSPSEFYLQLSEAVETIETLQATLQEQVESFPDLENPAAGVLCAAPYSLDQQWYRAQVLDADSDITTVRYVDFGNTDVLSNDTTHVKTLPSDLLSLEQHARRCSVMVKSTDVEWSPAACERFEQLTNFEHLTAEIIHQDEKTTFVELYASGLNVAQVLLLEGLATKLQLETESSCSGYVSHLNSPSEFWVQLENSVADLEWIAEQLSTAENFPELEDLTPGSLCAALFPDDEMWYRARILSNTVAGLEVLFIDYGNSCTCTGLRQLPEDLIMLPALAQKCSLQKPTGVLQWSAEATEVFKNISADGAAVFNIDKLSTGETTVVRLLLDGKDIATELLPKTQDAYIRHFESISSFWLQKAEDSPKLETITEKLVGALEWPKYDSKEKACDLVAALYADDESWYRAKIVEEKDSVYEVLFVDFGNAATTSEVRILPDDIEQESPLASKCKLDLLPGCRWNDESSKQLAVISNEGTTLFQVEFAAGDVVRLYLNGNDIRADLDSTCVSSLQSTPKKSAVMTTDNIIPQDIESLVDESELALSDTKAGDTLVVEVLLEHSDEQGAESLSTEVEANKSTSADMKELVEEIVRSSEVLSNDDSEITALTIDNALKVDTEYKIEATKTVDEFAPSKDMTTNLQSERLFEAGHGETLSDSVKSDEASDVKTNECIDHLVAGDRAVIPDSIKTGDDSDVKARELIDNSSSGDVIPDSIKSEDHSDVKTSEFIDNSAAGDVIPDSIKSEDHFDVKTSEFIDNSAAGDVIPDSIKSQDDSDVKTNEFIDHSAAGDVIPDSIKSEDYSDVKTNESIDHSTAGDVIPDSIKSEDHSDVKTSEFIDNSAPGDVIPDSIKLENHSDVKTSEFTDNSAPGDVIPDPIKSEDHTDVTTSEFNDNSTAEDVIPDSITFEDDSDVKARELIDNSAAGDVIPDSIKSNDDSDVKTSECVDNSAPGDEKVIPDSIKSDSVSYVKGSECTLKNVSNLVAGDAEVVPSVIHQLDVMDAKQPEKPKANIKDKETTRYEDIGTSNAGKSKSDLEKSPSEEQLSSDISVYPMQRRASTPHCDKIVPGSVSRGDLTEVEADCMATEVADLENLSEPEDNDSPQLMTPVVKTAIEDLFPTPPSNLSSCKVALDERIVPGCVSRGETPEPSTNDVDKTVVGACNGIEMKDNAMT